MRREIKDIFNGHDKRINELDEEIWDIKKLTYVGKLESRKITKISFMGQEYEAEIPLSTRIWQLEEKQKELMTKVDLILEKLGVEVIHHKPKNTLEKKKDA